MGGNVARCVNVRRDALNVPGSGTRPYRIFSLTVNFHLTETSDWDTKDPTVHRRGLSFSSWRLKNGLEGEISPKIVANN